MARDEAGTSQGQKRGQGLGSQNQAEGTLLSEGTKPCEGMRGTVGSRATADMLCVKNG